MMAARGHVRAHHPADRLMALPINVALVRSGLERQQLATRLAAPPRPNAGAIVLRRDPGPTRSIGTPVGRVDDHPVDRRVARPSPDEVAVALPGDRARARGTRAEPDGRCRARPP